MTISTSVDSSGTKIVEELFEISEVLSKEKRADFGVSCFAVASLTGGEFVFRETCELLHEKGDCTGGYVFVWKK